MATGTTFVAGPSNGKDGVIMGPSKRARDKGTAAAAALLPGANIRAYAVGRAHARISGRLILIAAFYLAVFVVAAAFGYLLIPGVPMAFVLYSELRPLRAVVVSDRGIAVMARSFWNGRPNAVLAVLPLAPFFSPESPASVTLPLGSDQITFNRDEINRLARATAPIGPS